MDKQNIETLYPLAPLQQAFLWHSLQASSQAGLLHMRCTLRGELDPDLLRQAWEFVVSQHPVLRTSVHWEAVKQPLQVVAKQVTLPWVQLDWRDHKDPQQALTEFLANDRDRGFDLTQAPISRLALIRLSETDSELIWSCHHLTLDGWSGALVLNQVLNTYETLHQGKPPADKPAPTYQTYLRWLKQQNEATAATFWKETLQGFTTPTPRPASDRTTLARCSQHGNPIPLLGPLRQKRP
ncbi:MAG: condensation domain-containing protein [Cyanobacteria bacterium P01_A01_bin.123]